MTFEAGSLCPRTELLASAQLPPLLPHAIPGDTIEPGIYFHARFASQVEIIPTVEGKMKQICKINLIPQRVSAIVRPVRGACSGIKITPEPRTGRGKMRCHLVFIAIWPANPRARLDHMLFIFGTVVAEFSHIYEPLSGSHLLRSAPLDWMEKGV